MVIRTFNLLKTFFVALLLQLLITACIQNISQVKLAITSIKVIDSIPSGSGIAMKGTDSAYIIGDDATAVYLININNYGYSHIQVAGMDAASYREEKPVKHDFESATMLHWNHNSYLLAFGSGSNPVPRDSLLILNTSDNHQRVISLRQLYSELQVQTGTDSLQWNIEGSTVSDDSLVLLNRGDNAIIRMDQHEFINYLLRPGSPVPPAKYTRIDLPSIEGKQARLSGVCTLDNGDLLFCASVEDTPDWTTDGPVLGSFIGLYSIESKFVEASFLLRDHKGIPLKEKIESIDVISSAADGTHQVIAISDNDNGSSKLFRIVFNPYYAPDLQTPAKEQRPE